LLFPDQDLTPLLSIEKEITKGLEKLLREIQK